MKTIIIGGGASGLFCAGFLAKNGVETIIFEHSSDTAKKILVTGKGRCNVTNNCDEETFLKNVRTNPKFLYSAIYGFPPPLHWPQAGVSEDKAVRYQYIPQAYLP